MRGSGRRCGLWKAWTGDEWGGQGPAGHYLQHLPGHRWRRLEVDGRVDGWGGWQLWWLRHVVHGRLLLLHAFPSLLLLRLLPHQLHAQPNARRHGGRRRWLPVDRGPVLTQTLGLGDGARMAKRALGDASCPGEATKPSDSKRQMEVPQASQPTFPAAEPETRTPSPFPEVGQMPPHPEAGVSLRGSA